MADIRRSHRRRIEELSQASLSIPSYTPPRHLSDAQATSCDSLRSTHAASVESPRPVLRSVERPPPPQDPPAPVPESCFPALRGLQSAARRVCRLGLPTDDEAASPIALRREALRFLRAQQREFTHRVEAEVRAAPINADAATPSILAALARLVEQHDQIIGLLRYVAELPQLPSPLPEPTSELEEEAGSGGEASTATLSKSGNDDDTTFRVKEEETESDR
ncbi:MAG: hypothetical protein M1839_004564 [Geoglossum umbratile]|nr:MAG: hypothetical protein M1839_004564 [Geoglossum umbratile]